MTRSQERDRVWAYHPSGGTRKRTPGKEKVKGTVANNRVTHTQ
jgi:hypothetical protein